VEQRLCYGAKQLDDQKLSLSTAFMVDALNLLGRLSGGNPGKSTRTLLFIQLTLIFDQYSIQMELKPPQ